MEYWPFIRNDDGFQKGFHVAGNVYTNEELSEMLKVNKGAYLHPFVERTFSSEIINL